MTSGPTASDRVASELAYLDASAFIKLILDEPESEAFEHVSRPFEWTSSAILEVEATVGVRRRQPALVDDVRALLGSVRLIEIDARVRQAACGLPTPACARSTPSIWPRHSPSASAAPRSSPTTTA